MKGWIASFIALIIWCALIYFCGNIGVLIVIFSLIFVLPYLASLDDT